MTKTSLSSSESASKQWNGLAMTTKLGSPSLDQLFLKARTHKAWTDRPVSEQQLRELYDLLKMGPTSMNTCPARFVWVRSAEGKSTLAACASAMPTNQTAIQVGREIRPTKVERVKPWNKYYN